MIRVNENFAKLESSYLFSEIKSREEAFQKAHPNVKVIRLGIGDVTLPLPSACINALHQAVDEMSKVETFRGYGPENGYAFLREAVVKGDFDIRNVKIDADEIFISDGSKCDIGNFQELFAREVVVAVQDPVYPAYVDINVMAGRTGERGSNRYAGLVYLEGEKCNNYLPDLPKNEVDLIYLCFPNNPTGAVASKDYLKRWVAYAQQNNAIILFDAAYAAFIRDPEIPTSIFEIEGAKEVAVEFRSYSKTAGFTGLRCAYTVVPKECRAFDSKGEAVKLHPLWNRRHSTKFNGVAYPVQCAAAAIYSEQGVCQVKELTDYYLENAKLIRKTFIDKGYHCVGGDNSPYVWVEGGKNSWEIFELLLHKAGVVCTPGVGFGSCGQGYIRISAFNSHDNVINALKRIAEVL